MASFETSKSVPITLSEGTPANTTPSRRGRPARILGGVVATVLGGDLLTGACASSAPAEITKTITVTTPPVTSDRAAGAPQMSVQYRPGKTFTEVEEYSAHVFTDYKNGTGIRGSV